VRGDGRLADGARARPCPSATRRKRKPRYPKGFDPANPGPPPDPERWLPKKERSTYRRTKVCCAPSARGPSSALALTPPNTPRFVLVPRSPSSVRSADAQRDKKSTAQMRGPQGGNSSASAAFDISTAKGGAGPSSAGAPILPPPGEGGRNKKKKGKKGGW
jgi:hypothetical protein